MWAWRRCSCAIRARVTEFGNQSTWWTASTGRWRGMKSTFLRHRRKLLIRRCRSTTLGESQADVSRYLEADTQRYGDHAQRNTSGIGIVIAHFGEEFRSTLSVNGHVEPEPGAAADAITHEGPKNLIDLYSDGKEAEERIENNFLGQGGLRKLHAATVVAHA